MDHFFTRIYFPLPVISYIFHTTADCNRARSRGHCLRKKSADINSETTWTVALRAASGRARRKSRSRFTSSFTAAACRRVPPCPLLVPASHRVAPAALDAGRIKLPPARAELSPFRRVGTKRVAVGKKGHARD